MTETEAKARRVLKDLVAAAIRTQELGNRLLHLGPVNRPHGNAVRDHALAMARTARAMGGLGMAGTAELYDFFGDTLNFPAPVPGQGYDDDAYLRQLRAARPATPVADTEAMARGLAIAAELRDKYAAARVAAGQPPE